MKFMVEWTIPTGTYEAAVRKFLEAGAPMPAGLTSLGRWHEPGSRRGWLLCETDDPVSLAEHTAEWAGLLETRVTPVIEDEGAGRAAGKVYGG